MILKRIALLFTYSLSFFGAFAQVIPDLTTGDHFRPYLSEEQKQKQILNPQKEYPKTSTELYPHLYKYTNQDYLAPIRGTSADPANAFKDYSKTEYMKPAGNSNPVNNAVTSAMYNNQLSIQERNRLQIEADMKAYETQKINQQRVLEEANKEFAPQVNYDLGLHTGDEADRYEKAYEELQTMLDGSQKIDFLRAVWLVESAVDPSLSWDEFNGRFKDGVQIIMELMRQDKLSPNDNLAKIMSIYKYMSDTTKVYVSFKEKTIVSKPFLYDYEDYEAKKDITKVFVSKLLRTGSGQCMSLPMLFYLYAKALNADANIAFAPEHSYITFKDKLGVRQNIELTGRMLTTPDFYWQTGFIKAEQVKSGIYLTPATEKETLAYLLTTLSIAYVRNFGADNRLFEMANTAKEHFPNSLTANMLLFGYSNELLKNVERQYSIYGLSEQQFQQDEKAQAIKQNRKLLYDHLMKTLGYAKMPEFAYQAWLNTVKESSNRNQHLIRKRQLEQQLLR